MDVQEQDLLRIIELARRSGDSGCEAKAQAHLRAHRTRQAEATVATVLRNLRAAQTKAA